MREQEKRERTGGGEREKERYRVQGSGQRDKRGWDGAIAREKGDASERDGGHVKMRAWEKEDS